MFRLCWMTRVSFQAGPLLDKNALELPAGRALAGPPKGERALNPTRTEPGSYVNPMQAGLGSHTTPASASSLSSDCRLLSSSSAPTSSRSFSTCPHAIARACAVTRCSKDFF